MGLPSRSFSRWALLALVGTMTCGRDEAATASAEPKALKIVPGEYEEFEAAFTAGQRRFASRSDDRWCAATGAHAAVAVPTGFSPERAWPVLLVSATADPGFNSSRKWLRVFMAPALKAGWVVVAADANSDKDEDTNNLRYALLVAALARLQVEWPHLAEWPMAFGGFSGGAKRSAVLAAVAVRLGNRPIGVFQGGCNEPTMSRVLDVYRPDRAQFLGVPVFLSGGSDDPIATPEQVEEVADELRRSGFTHVRYQQFQGKHEVHAEHVEEALRWFVELAAQPARKP